MAIEGIDLTTDCAQLTGLEEVILGGGDFALALVPWVLVHDLRAVLVRELLEHGLLEGGQRLEVRMELAVARFAGLEEGIEVGRLGWGWGVVIQASASAAARATSVIEEAWVESLGLAHGSQSRNYKEGTHFDES